MAAKKKQHPKYTEPISTSKNVNWIDVGLIFANYVIFIAMTFFNVSSTFPLEALFPRSSSDTASERPVEITPAAWTFSTWIIVYIWQAMWLIFCVVLTCVRTRNAKMYKQPAVFTAQFHLFMLSNFLLNAGWIFLWCNFEFGVGFGFIMLMAGTVYIASIISHRNTFEAERYFQDSQQ